jgi:predicted TIM-barrel fold metal-dependent hydrolase
MRIWDPHFHVWDVSDRTSSGHDPSHLFAPQGNPIYSLTNFESDLAIGGFELTGGVCVEAMSVCHVGHEDAEFSQACLAEARWVSNQLSCSPRAYRMVASAPLESPDIGRILGALARFPTVCGIRQILNHEPSWPRNKRLGNLLDNRNWTEGYRLLEDFGLSFDLQLNPGQFQRAVELVAGLPRIPVIIGHLGCPTLGDLRDGHVYWEGMKAFADLEHVSIKLSMLSYPDPNWHQNALVKEAVLRVVELFGVERCCFASNFPVEGRFGWSPERLYREYRELMYRSSEADQQKLFAESARRVYRRK